MTLCLKVVPASWWVAIINGGNCFYSSEWRDITVLRKWSDKECRLIRYICLSVGETGRSKQGALIFIIVCGVC